MMIDSKAIKLDEQKIASKLTEEKLKQRSVIKDEINDSKQNNGSNNDKHSTGYLALPDKLPLSIVIGWLVQFTAMIIGGTLIYSEMKTELMLQKKEIASLQSVIDQKMYTRQEADLRAEVFKSELEKIKAEARFHNMGQLR